MAGIFMTVVQMSIHLDESVLFTLDTSLLESIVTNTWLLNRITQCTSLMCFMGSSVFIQWTICFFHLLSSYCLPDIITEPQVPHDGELIFKVGKTDRKYKEIHERQANYRFWGVMQSKQGVMLLSIGSGGNFNGW